MYDSLLLKPMREELTSIGIKELRTSEEVDECLSAASGTTLVVVNSVCGCAAGGARPGVKLALQNSKKPTLCTTVFAGQDKEATEKAREYFTGHKPSSPSLALLKNGELVFMMERADIEGSSPEGIAQSLVGAFEEHC